MSKITQPAPKKTRQQIKEHPLQFAVYVILRVVVLVMLALALFRGEYESAFMCMLALVLFVLPGVIERSFGIDLPSTLEIVILLFIFASQILGELQNYYVRFPYWDTLLHTVNGFVCAAFGFSLVDILCRNKQEKFRLSPLYMALVAFCFSMTVGVMWEFFEYGMDRIFHMDMQKDTIIPAIYSVALNSAGENRVVVLDNIEEVLINGQPLGVAGYLDIGLWDTMNDLLVNFIGAVVFSVIGFIYITYRGRGRVGRLAAQFIPQLLEEQRPEQGADTPENTAGEGPV